MVWTVELRGRWHGEVREIELLSLLFLKVHFIPINHGLDKSKMLRCNVVL